MATELGLDLARRGHEVAHGCAGDVGVHLEFEEAGHQDGRLGDRRSMRETQRAQDRSDCSEGMFTHGSCSG